MANDRYYIGSNPYSQTLNSKTQQYTNLVRDAEAVRLRNGGRPTREEGLLYREAVNVCAEIINMNLGQREVVNRWNMVKRECEAELDRICAALQPAAPPTPPTQPAGPKTRAAVQTVSNTSASGSGTGKTESGFTTKNAVKDVPAETIEKWFKSKPAHSLEDVTGMEEQKRMLMQRAGSLGWDRIDSALNISPVQSFFFYGAPGCGKTYLIEAFASEMMDKGFKFIRLLGGDIHASLVGVAEKTVQIAFQEAIDNEPCIIFIDEIENVCVNRSNSKAEGHEKRLTVAFLEAYNLLKESKKRVIFMGATNYPSMVDEAMLDRITMVRIPLPDAECRAQHFSRKLRYLTPEAGFTWDEMAGLTDNYSYRDLDRLVESLLEDAKAEAIRTHQVLGPDGKEDQEKTDIAASEAISSGEIGLTRERFNRIRTMLPPSSKKAIQAELDAFEAHIRSTLA